MRNIPFDEGSGLRLPRQVQLERVRKVICQELTQIERETLMAYYFQELNILQIAQLRGVNKSTVSRNLKRAENRLREYLKY